MLGRVNDVASVLMKVGGLSESDAGNAAAKYVAKSTFMYNGAAVPGVNFMPIDDAQKVFDKKVDELLPAIKERNPGLSKSDITVMNLGDGRFGLRDKSTGMPISLAHMENGHIVGGPVVMTQKQMAEYAASLKAQETATKDGSTIMSSDTIKENLEQSKTVHDTLEEYFKRKRPQGMR
jgi:hypothetical protein